MQEVRPEKYTSRHADRAGPPVAGVGMGVSGLSQGMSASVISPDLSVYV